MVRNLWLKMREERKNNPPLQRMPETYEEAIQFVYERINPDTVSSPMFHMTGGMAVRNTLGLWDKESPLHKHMLERFGLCHADDTGALITDAAHAMKNGEDYDPQAWVDICVKHWHNAGYDPKTMEKLNGRP